MPNDKVVNGAVGIEVEFHSILLDIAGRYAPDGWRVTRDGSCTKKRRVVGLGQDMVVGQLEAHGDDWDGPRDREAWVGGEFVSPPISIEEGMTPIIRDVSQITGNLLSLGEEVGLTTSIHVHVNFGMPPKYVLFNLFKQWEALEAVIYRLSVAEHQQHRGAVYHDYLYCRPLTAPQIVKDCNGSWRYCYDLDKIYRNAKTTEEVLRAWGRCDIQEIKWQPYRYYGLNIANLINGLGTVEFRTFNQTMQPMYIRSWVEFCVAMCRMAWMDRKVSGLSPFPLGSHTPDHGHEFSFENIKDIIPPSLMTDAAWNGLEKLWKTWSWQPGCLPQVNHLVRSRQYNRRVALDELPPRLRPDELDGDFVSEVLANCYDPNEED